MPQNLSLALTGFAGRMGLAMRELIAEHPDVTLVAGFEQPGHPLVGQRLDGVPVHDSLGGRLVGVDALIDFAPPAAMAAHAALAAAAGVPFVSGTTGLGPAEQAALDRAAAHIPLLWAPNLSLGVAVLAHLVAQAAATLGEGFDVEITELHHRHKVDAPSGTALRLVEAVQSARALHPVFGREGRPGARPADEIGVHALRGGDVVGEHTVLFAGLGERLELSHRASSRHTFAQGALRAARFLQGRPPGRYTMEQVLA